MMQSMGMQVEELRDVNRIILQSPKREIIIEGASVSAINVQGQKIYQIAGGRAVERTPQSTQQTVPATIEKPAISIPEEDVLLVSQQANVSMDKARDTLIKCDGDLARAILMLQTS